MWRTVNCPQRVMIFLLSIFITGGLSVPINIVDNQTATLTMRPLREGSFRPSQGDIIVHRVSKSRQDGAIKPTKRAGRQFIIYGGCSTSTYGGGYALPNSFPPGGQYNTRGSNFWDELKDKDNIDPLFNQG
ncbi:uncharacterized protein LOC110855062 isoform X2 [Folsomia candida]|uniref:uncharacterized protein LOC110855062 isoform X2 n=1 Tax=Folsomia candida TaxID=158441 RepID=UPI000B8FE662|nr:uncharacterized protein LOC110855062 isoform X2 [Folsomia candida]